MKLLCKLGFHKWQLKGWDLPSQAVEYEARAYKCERCGVVTVETIKEKK